MRDKDKILGRIREIGLAEVPLPEIPIFREEAGDSAAFVESLRQSRARVVEWDGGDFPGFIRNEFPGRLWSSVPEVPGDPEWQSLMEGPAFSGLQTAVVRASFGVSENGAMWICEEDLRVPVIPFIVAHLVVVVSRKELVSDMHAAYARIQFGEHAFGLFVSGPSKTADIEQSMVIGAHGPLGLTVVIQD